MSAHHTPGPWRARALKSALRGNIYFVSANRTTPIPGISDQTLVADCGPVLRETKHSRDECEANACLIAAAPALLAALAEVVEHAEKYGGAPSSAEKMLGRARAVLAWAKGGAS